MLNFSNIAPIKSDTNNKISITYRRTNINNRSEVKATFNTMYSLTVHTP